MTWFKVVEREKVELKDPVIIVGLPNIGLIGTQVVEYLISQLKPVKMLEMYSEHLLLPNNATGILVQKDGTLNLPRITVYGYKGEKEDIILVLFDFQPSPLGVYRVMEDLLDCLSKYNPKFLIALSGYANPDKAGEIYAMSNNPELLKRAVEQKAKGEKIVEEIIGGAGVLISVAILRGMDVLSLTAVTENVFKDFVAAREMLEVISGLLELEIDYSDIEREIEEYERGIGIRDIREIFEVEPREE